MLRKNLPQLVLLSLIAVVYAQSGATTPTPATPGEDVIWYISPQGSSDVSTCGHTIDNPCEGLQTILSSSGLFNDSGFLCYLSEGATDERASTTVYFVEGVNYVPPICLSNWQNVRIVGLNNVTITSSLGTQRGFFDFINCTNVTIEGLEFSTSFANRPSLNFERSVDISIRRCIFPVTAFASYGVSMQDCAGNILLDDSEFFGDPGFSDRRNPIRALVILQGDPGQSTLNDQPYEPFSAVINKCIFRDLASGGPLDQGDDSYRGVRSNVIGLYIRFYSGSHDNRIVVQKGLFQRNVNIHGSIVSVNYDTGSMNNTVLFEDCDFVRNEVRYGGGIAAYFFSRPETGLLEVDSCRFVNNSADFEGGGLLAVFLSRDVTSQVNIRSSTFVGNYAQYGAGVFLFNSPAWSDYGPPNAVAQPLVAANITNSTFEDNEALLTEGTVNALRILLRIDGTNSFTGNYGSAVVLRSSLLYISGTVVFERNVAGAGAALKLFDTSRIDMSEVKQANFTGNKAIFSGGAIYADDGSTSLSADEYNHTLAAFRFNYCFAVFGNEPGNPLRDKGRFIFDNNTALLEGQTINAYNLRGCIISNFVPTGVARFLRIPSDGTVVFANTDMLGATATGPSYLFFYGASTRCYKHVGNITYLLPNCSHALLNETFLVYKQDTSMCFPNCSDAMLDEKLYVHPNLSCAIEALDSELNSYYGPGGALEPTVDKFITPWAGIETSWTEEPGSIRSRCIEVNPGDLYLSPAPGEQFDLTIQLADQLLNYISNTIYVKLEHEIEQPPGVLIQLNGIQYSYNDRVYFTPNRALSGIALVGLPGQEGRLEVIADSQILGQKIILLIPFKLAQCPLGYYDPPGAKTLEEVNALILTQFSVTQRIPSDQPLGCQCFSSPSVSVQFSDRVSTFPHQCIAGYTVNLNSVLWAGLIPIEEEHKDLSQHPARVDCPDIYNDAVRIEDDLTEWIMEERAELVANGSTSVSELSFNPVDVVPYEGDLLPGGGAPIKCFKGQNVSELVEFEPTEDAEFTIEVCTRGYCKGDVRSNWYLVDVNYPCVEHREGPLCGQCKSGYAVTLYSTNCRDCSSPPNYIPGLPWVFTIFFGLALVVGIVWLNFGLSPTLDSLLFFVQAVAIILSSRTDYERYQYLAIFNPDFTFNLCISPNLDGLGRLLLQYITPIYILVLLGGVLLLTRIKGFAKYLGKHSFLQAVWFLFLITYFNIANTTFEILHCRLVGPVHNGVRRLVLAQDPSVGCYEGLHLPFAIIAILLAVFFVVPLPIYVLVLTRFPRLKPITDVYSSCYRDKYRPWVAWSVARRLLLVLVGVFIQDVVNRHFSLLLSCILILVVYVKTWPYQHKVDNHFGFFVTWILVVVACITQPESYIDVDRSPGTKITDPPDLFWSSFFVSLVISIGFIIVGLEIWLRTRKMTLGEFYLDVVKPQLMQGRYSIVSRMSRIKNGKSEQHELEESTSSSIIPRSATIDATAYREPLLDSLLDNSSTNTYSSDRRRKPRVGQTRKTRTRTTATVVSTDRTTEYSHPTTANVSTNRTTEYSRPTATIVSTDLTSEYSDEPGFAYSNVV